MFEYSPPESSVTVYEGDRFHSSTLEVPILKVSITQVRVKKVKPHEDMWDTESTKSFTEKKQELGKLDENENVKYTTF